MRIIQGLYPIVKKTALAKEIYDMTVFCPELANLAEPGQFTEIRPGSQSRLFLRRPISLCGIDREKGTVRLVFEVRGEGTKQISQLPCGSLIDLMGPLGHGFAVPKQGERAILIGGGIGVPPMLELAKRYGKNAVAILGFRSANAVILEEDFKAMGAETVLCTDDGTKGRKGFVTQALEEVLKEQKADIICACGPFAMLHGVYEIAAKNNIRCQVSLEERMACGVGACLGCACKMKKPDGSEGYLHVCKDGPVFEAAQVVWEK